MALPDILVLDLAQERQHDEQAWLEELYQAIDSLD